MTSASAPLTAALLALPESTASTLFGMFDVFSSVGRDWDFVMNGAPGQQLVRPLLVAPETAPFRAANGVMLTPDADFSTCPSPDLICIPDLFVLPGQDLAGGFDTAISWLQDAYSAGATVAAACSGALLLAEAGLLDGGEATTHWAYCDAMTAGYPEIKVHGARVLVASGPGQRILTSGGGTSWQDMALFLVARFIGQEEAMRIARLYLLDWHAAGQLPFSALAGTRRAADAEIAAAQVWLADNYANPRAITDMINRSTLPERSFKRRFTKATGMAPIDYVHTLRLEEAKQLLETSDEPVEAIAVEIGYEDASFFRRLFRRKVGVTPSAYRRQFQTIRMALSSAEMAPPRMGRRQ